MKKMIQSLLVAFICFLLLPINVNAGSPTDEILDYTITAVPNNDATVDLTYHVDWLVLESDGIGPMSWVKIGIPNSYCLSSEALSENITDIRYTYENGQFFVEVYLDKDYYEGETASFDFKIKQDYLFEVNVLKEGETVFYFTPGWFDEIAVDSVTVRWASANAIAWGAHGLNKGEYLEWTGSLAAGEVFDEISVTYPTDNFNIPDEKFAEEIDYTQYADFDNKGSYNNYDSYDDDEDGASIFGGFVLVVGIVIWVLKKLGGSYSKGSGFTTTTQKKVTRTLIKYYPECPGCGAARPENADKCEYCGRSFIESEEVIEEKDIKEPEKYKTDGIYKYGDAANTFVRVHVTTVPVRVPVTRSSCAHSSCVHSSCACAHSCACACACACAGGGRAGCTTKDFYNTGLKLKQLELKESKAKSK